MGCKFDYSQFSYTQVEPEILDTGCPGQENLQQRFARTLRINFQQIGDAATANSAIKVELEATRVHLYKGIVRLNLLGRLSLSPFWDFRAQKQLLSGLDRTGKNDEAGSTTGKY